MKRFLKKFSGLFLSILFVIAVAGCTSPVSKVTTTLYLNADGSGERVMHVDINRTDFNEQFKGTFDDLTKLISEKKADALEYSTLDDEENFSVTFTLKFTSVDDYNAKMAEIVSDYSDDEKLVFQSADSIWKYGANIKENLSTTKPLQWLVDAIVEAGYVDAGDKGYILGAATTTLYYEGEQANTYSLNWNGLDQLYVTEIAQNITAYGTDTFNLEYQFNLGLYTYTYSKQLKDFDKSAIVSYMKEMAGDKAIVEAEDTDILVKYENVNAAAVKEVSAKLFDNATFEVSRTGNNGRVFENEYTITESFDVSKYINEDIRAYMSVRAQIEYLNGYRSTTSTGNYASCQKDEQGSALFTGDFGFSMRYTISDMNFETVVTDEESVKQVITFTLNETLSKEEQENITANIDEFMNTPSSGYVTPTGEAADDGKFKYEFKVSTKKDKYIGELTFKGDMDTVVEGLKRFTGRDAGMNLLTNKSTFKTKYTKSYEIKYDLGTFSQYTGQDFNGTATVDLGSGAKITECSVDSAMIDKNEATFRVKTGSVRATINAECTNGFAYVLIAIVVVLVIAALVVLAMILLKVAKANKPAANAGAAFCPNCGAKLDKGTAFCQNCGTKVQ